ncbi:alpha amylase C-terminal domain-containing protein [Arenibacter certesii]|uniref:1,4-alpha-glucan branching enzyme n=1 Tax=Arenibacter certesii TaxID=228955 RepID=A0A918MPJ3_9FLAO|nr:alpha amylase C-terminal domain-containing protein [Arenibacter certesii]GGW42390.1 1,4-alpha-glucan branching enzyme [Arenibacter certesii]
MDDIGSNTIASNAKGSYYKPNDYTFRLWAPHADSVSIIGDFNNWEEDLDFMKSENNGHWSLTLNHAKQGDHYKFVIQSDTSKLYREDPYAIEFNEQNETSVITTTDFDWTDYDFKIVERKKMVIYQLDVGYFFSELNYNKAEPQHILEPISYLNALGINTIEIALPPPLVNPKKWSYHPSRPMSLSKEMGGYKAFANLVNLAHRQGIAVIMSLDISHFDSTSLLWHFDAEDEENEGGIYFYGDYRSNSPWGPRRPNYSCNEVRKYLQDTALLWIETYHCDGICFVNTDYVRHTNGISNSGAFLEDGKLLLNSIVGEIKTKYPSKILIAEEKRYDPLLTTPLTEGGFGFDIQRNSESVNSISQVLTANKDDDRQMGSLMDAMKLQEGGRTTTRIFHTVSQRSISEHGRRLADIITSNQVENNLLKKRITLAGLLTLTAPGIPMLFQGQENLAKHYFIREQLNWNNLTQCQGIIKLFSDLIKFRKSGYLDFIGLQGSLIDFIYLSETEKVIAYQRAHSKHPKNKLCVIINFSKRHYENFKLKLPAKGLWKLIFNSGSNSYDDMYDNLPVSNFNAEKAVGEGEYEGTFCLPAYVGLIYINRE